MKDLLFKLKVIYAQFLLVAIGFVVIYSFIIWLIVYRFSLLVLNEELINFWLPFCLPCIPIYIWLRPRIKLLSLKTKKDNLPFLYFFVAWLAIAAPAVVLQQYLLTATGKLTGLNNIDEIARRPRTKYYRLKAYYIDKKHFGFYRRNIVSGKNNEYLDFHIYLTCPILIHAPKQDSAINLNLKGDKKPLVLINGVLVSTSDSLNSLRSENIANVTIIKGKSAIALHGLKAKDGIIAITTKVNASISGAPEQPVSMPIAWLGTEYRKTISNNLSDTEKENIYKEFNKDSFEKFKFQNLNSFTYLDRIGNDDNHKGYKEAIKALPAYDGKDPVILEASHEPFELRNGDKLSLIFKSFSIGAGIWLIMIIIPGVNRVEVKKLPEYSASSDFKSSLDDLLHNKLLTRLPVTNSIIALNILVFVVMVFAGLGFISFDSKDLYNWGANYRPAVIDGQWWRLFTCIFLHGGLMHLLMNMYGLFVASVFLEPMLGRIKYITAYFTCGLFASVASIWWHAATVSIGASGAIFGLFGVLTALLTTNKAESSIRKPVLIYNAVFIGINLLLGIRGSVDNAAHIGGLLSGLIIGYIFYFFIETPNPKPKPIYKRRKKVIKPEEEASH